MKHVAFIITLFLTLVHADTSHQNFPYIQPIAVEKPDRSEKSYFADSDKDGVRDDQDECPNTVKDGYVDIFGCIILDDDDQDGVSNDKDECPQTPPEGVVNLKGCEPDGDNDGIPDSKDNCPGTQEGFLTDNTGCPQAKRLNIHFETKDSQVNADYLFELEDFAHFLIDNEQYQAIIYGYTDSSEAPETDKRLAQKRANEVMEHIISFGVKLTRLTAIGMGSKNPIAPNDTTENRAKNRRIEVELLQ